MDLWIHPSWASEASSSSSAFLSPVASEIDRGRAISESRHGTTCFYCHRYTYRRLLYISHRRSKCPVLQVVDREPVISSASQPLTCMYGTLIYQGYGSYPTYLASHHYSHGAPDRSVISSESIFSRILLPVTSGFQPSPFELPKDCLSRLITDQANATPARLSSTGLHRVLKHAHSHLFRHEPTDLLFLPFLTTFVRAMPFFTQTYADENRLPILFSQRLSHAGTRSSEDSLAYSTQSGILPAPHH